MANRFYIKSCDLAPGEVYLDGAEAKHLSVVCRLRPGDAITLFNGDGQEYPARVLEVDRRHVTLDIEAVASPSRELPVPLVVAAPVPKGDRAQFLVEKLTELGVRKYVPLQTTRSVVHPSDAKREKLQRYVVEASKQCGRNRLMEIAEVTTWSDWLATPGSSKVFAHPESERLSEILEPGLPESGLLLALGPEGGLTDEEVTEATRAGWKSIGLGPRILRIETAALALVVGCCTLYGV